MYVIQGVVRDVSYPITPHISSPSSKVQILMPWYRHMLLQMGHKVYIFVSETPLATFCRKIAHSQEVKREKIRWPSIIGADISR